MVGVNVETVNPKTEAGGSLADLYDTLPRGIAVAGFASATFLGPVLGPIGKLFAPKEAAINARAQLTVMQLEALSPCRIWAGVGHNGFF